MDIGKKYLLDNVFVSLVPQVFPYGYWKKTEIKDLYAEIRIMINNNGAFVSTAVSRATINNCGVSEQSVWQHALLNTEKDITIDFASDVLDEVHTDDILLVSNVYENYGAGSLLTKECANKAQKMCNTNSFYCIPYSKHMVFLVPVLRVGKNEELFFQDVISTANKNNGKADILANTVFSVELPLSL